MISLSVDQSYTCVEAPRCLSVNANILMMWINEHEADVVSSRSSNPTEPDPIILKALTLATGSFFNTDSEREVSQVAVLNQKTARILFLDHNDPLGRVIVFSQWSNTFADDTTLTAALLDRLLHHAHITQIAGRASDIRDGNCAC